MDLCFLVSVSPQGGIPLNLAAAARMDVACPASLMEYESHKDREEGPKRSRLSPAWHFQRTIYYMRKGSEHDMGVASKDSVGGT